MYRYQLRGRSLTIPGRVIRMTVIAANADDAHKVAAIRNPDFGHTIQTPRRTGLVVSSFIEDQDARCRFCHRYVTDGLYTRVSFPDGVANVCDICREKADEDVVEWRDTEVEVVG